MRTIDVHTLLLQQEPFVAVDRLVACEERNAESETTVRAESIFVRDGRLTAGGIVENIAQTASLHFGYRSVYVLHRGVSVGMLAAIGNLRILRRPETGEQLLTRVEVRESAFGIVLMHGSVFSGGELVAEGDMKFSSSEG